MKTIIKGLSIGFVVGLIVAGLYLFAPKYGQGNFLMTITEAIMIPISIPAIPIVGLLGNLIKVEGNETSYTPFYLISFVLGGSLWGMLFGIAVKMLKNIKSKNIR